MEKNIIPICFAIDDAYTPFLAVALQSLIDNASKEYNYCIKVLHTNVKEEHMKQIKKYENEYVNIEFVDLNYYLEKVKDKLYTRDYYTNTTYFRLFLPELYPQYDKILYLDSDITIVGDISELYNTDMGTNLVAAAPDDIIQYNKVFQDYAELVVGVESYTKYFNAGVLLMNLDQLRKFKFQEKFIYLLTTVRFSVAQDQDYLNRLCKGRVTLVDRQWDCMPLVNATTKREDIKLVHYNFAYKPWHFEDVLYKEFFWEYAKKTEFYDENGNLVYSFNEGYSLPIIIKDTDRYGVEFNNRLLYIKSDEGEVINNTNTDKHNASGVGVFNYHAFYDENDPSDSCPTVICHSKKQFKEQLDYLKENNILTLKMKELEMYIDGKLQLPKSVLLTIDDGGRDKIAVDMLTEYKMYATIFLITAWYDPSTYYKTDYIELHSHTNNMHNTGVCPGGQGGGIKCLSEEEIQTDLKTSREKLGGSTYIAYPFYEYNEYSIRMLKEAGFTMAFAGEWDKSDNLVHVGSDKFRLRRFVIVTYTTIKGINEYLGQIK